MTPQQPTLQDPIDLEIIEHYKKMVADEKKEIDAHNQKVKVHNQKVKVANDAPFQGPGVAMAMGGVAGAERASAAFEKRQPGRAGMDPSNPRNTKGFSGFDPTNVPEAPGLIQSTSDVNPFSEMPAVDAEIIDRYQKAKHYESNIPRYSELPGQVYLGHDGNFYRASAPLPDDGVSPPMRPRDERLTADQLRAENSLVDWRSAKSNAMQSEYRQAYDGAKKDLSQKDIKLSATANMYRQGYKQVESPDVEDAEDDPYDGPTEYEGRVDSFTGRPEGRLDRFNRRIPYVGHAYKISRMLADREWQQRMARGEGTTDDYRKAGELDAHLEKEHGKEWWKKVADLALDMPAFMLELAPLGIAKNLPSTVSGFAAKSAKVGAGQPQFIASEAVRFSMPKAATDSEGRREYQLGEDNWVKNLVKGYTSVTAESASEMSGGYLKPIIDKIPGVKRFGKQVAKLTGEETALGRYVSQGLRKGGFNGAAPEWVEERVRDFMGGVLELGPEATRLGEGDFGTLGDLSSILTGDFERFGKGFYQSTIEFAAFLIPGMTSAGANAIAGREGVMPARVWKELVGPDVPNRAVRRELKKFMDDMAAMPQRERERAAREPAEGKPEDWMGWQKAQAEVMQSGPPTGDPFTPENFPGFFGQGVESPPIDPRAASAAREIAEKQQQRYQQKAAERRERELWSDPAIIAEWIKQDPLAAVKLAAKKTYKPEDFQEAGFESPIPDPAVRKQWKEMTKEYLDLPGDVRDALDREPSTSITGEWSRIPEDAEPPQSDSVEVMQTSFGDVVRIKPVEPVTPVTPVPADTTQETPTTPTPTEDVAPEPEATPTPTTPTPTPTTPTPTPDVTDTTPDTDEYPSGTEIEVQGYVRPFRVEDDGILYELDDNGNRGRQSVGADSRNPKSAAEKIQEFKDAGLKVTIRTTAPSPTPTPTSTPTPTPTTPTPTPAPSGKELTDEELEQRVIDELMGNPTEASPPAPSTSTSTPAPSTSTPTPTPTPKPKTPKPKGKGTIKKKVKKAKDDYDKASEDADKAIRDFLGGSTLQAGPPAQLAALIAKKMVAGVRVRGWQLADIVADMAGAYGRRKLPMLRELIEKAWNVVTRLDANAKAVNYDAIFKELEPAEVKDSGDPLVDHFAGQLDAGKNYKSIVEARKEASEVLGKTIKGGTLDAKMVDEKMERGVVLAARRIVADGKYPQATFDELVDLYDRHPNLSTRTSTSAMNQAYSTPAPLAYLANVLAGVTNKTTVLDSSAGNGMLFIGADLKNAVANEIEDERVASLKTLGVETTKGDATTFRAGSTVDAVIINPPFGEIGDGDTLTVDGVSTAALDHAIILNSLKAMKPDGKAVLILGAKGVGKSDDLDRGASYSKSPKPFYDKLYDKYNVTDHFTVAGKLYGGQGATFPVDVIVIDGVGASTRPRPWNYNEGGVPEIIPTWEELGEKLDTEQQPSSADTKQDSVDESPTVPARPSGVAPTTPSRPSDVADRNRKPIIDELEETEFQGAYSPGSKAPYQLGTLVPKNHVDAIVRALEAIEDKHGNIDEFVARELGYEDKEDMWTYFAGEQVDALAMAIHNQKNGAGFIIGDQTGIGKGRVVAGMIKYAQRQGYVPVFVTQMSSLYADMIRDLDNIGMNDPGSAFQVLHTDDLSGKKSVKLPDERVLSGKGKDQELAFKAAVKSFLAGDGLKASTKGVVQDFGAVFTTYFQMSRKNPTTTTWRQTELLNLAPNAYFILDESHNAGGTESGGWQVPEEGQVPQALGRAEFVRKAIADAPGVFYSSATFAKRANVMDLYSATDLAKSFDSPEAMIAAIEAGGVPLQQVISQMLVEAGQMIRRERSYAGVKFEAESVGVALSDVDKVSHMFREISHFDILAEPARRHAEGDAVSGGGGVLNDPSTGQQGIESKSFSSIMHNLVDQMLFAFKADAAADAAIAAHEKGEAPFVVVDNTMGAALQRYLGDNPTEQGEPVYMKFDALVDRYLQRSREITVYDENGDRQTVRLTDEQLGPVAMAQYEITKNLIKTSNIDIPSSPIDWIRYRLEQAGLSVAELTGREDMIDYGDPNIVMPIKRSHYTQSDPKKIKRTNKPGRGRKTKVVPAGSKVGRKVDKLGRRQIEEQGTRGKIKTIARYNAGELDVVIANRSGSTGLSAHASEDNPPAGQKPRHMIIVQAAKNVDEFMQMLGRIHRTGQVALPTFTLLMTDAPAERRPAALLTQKLASLNANVTGKSAGAIGFDAVDLINPVGDRIVMEYLENNRHLNTMMGDPVRVADNGTLQDPAEPARKITGKIVMLPVAQQEEFWEEITRQFLHEIEELDNRGMNPFTAQTLPLDAITKERLTLFEGEEDSNNPFDQPAYLETVDVKMLGSSLTSVEVRGKIAEFYGLEPSATASEINEANREWIKATSGEIEKEAQAFAAVRPEGMADEAYQSRVESIERSLAVVKEGLRMFPPGRSVKFTQDIESYSGTVIGVTRQSGGANPVAPSRWVINVAVADAIRTIRVPMSQIGNLERDTGFRLSGFDEVESASRETRYIATGNIPAAMGQLADQHGQIVFFTQQGEPVVKKKGGRNYVQSSEVVQRGVLMRRSFNPRRWADAKPVIVEDSKHALDFINRGGALLTPDGNMTISKQGRQLVVRARKSKSRGKKYWGNRLILAESAPQEFVTNGMWFDLGIEDSSRFRPLLKVILDQFPLQATTQRALAREIITQPPGDSTGTVAGMSLPTPKPKRSKGKTAKASKPSKSSKPVKPKAKKVPYDPTTQTLSTRKRTESDKVAIAAADIRKTVSRMFNVAILTGNFNHKAAGIYTWLTRSGGPSTSPEVARTAEHHYAKVGVIAHEVAHHLDETTGAVKSMPKAVREEIKDLDYDVARVNDGKGRDFEGWAEFVRRYVTEPPIDINGVDVPHPGVDAPQTLAWFEKTWLPEHPDLAKKIAKFREYAQQFAQQSVWQQVSTLITDRQPKDLEWATRWKDWGQSKVNKIKTDWVDKFHELFPIQEEAKKRGRTEKGRIGIYDMTMAYFMSATSHASVAFEEGVVALGTGRQIGRLGLFDLRKNLRSDSEYKDANLFALARHTVFMKKKKPGYTTGMTLKQAKTFIDQIEAESPEKKARFIQYAKELAGYNNDLIRMLVDAGAIPLKDAKKMIDYYGGDNYFPLHRVQDRKQTFVGTGVGFVNLGRAVPSRSDRGSERQTIDPIDATVARTIKFYQRAIQARQAHTLAETLDPRMGGVRGMGGLMDRVPPKVLPTQLTVEEILDQLVHEGLVEAEDAKSMKIASKILRPEYSLPSESEIRWFANRHGLRKDANGEYNQDDLKDAAESEPDSWAIITIWRPDYSPNDAKRIVVIHDKHGNPIMYEVDYDLWATITGMNDYEFGVWGSVFKEANRYFKTGAVGMSTGFGLSNLIRDYIQFQGQAEYVEGLSSASEPVKQLGKYMADKVRQKMGEDTKHPMTRLYDETGGKLYSRIGHDLHSRVMTRRRRMGTTTMSRWGLSVENPTAVTHSVENIFQNIMEFIAISDAPARLADGEAAIAEEGFVVRDNRWYDLDEGEFVDYLPEYVRIKAAIAMAEATVNFKRIGRLGAKYEAYIPFFNATIQSQYRQYRLLKTLRSTGKRTDEGLKAQRYLVFLAATIAHSAMYWMWRHDDDDWRNQDAWLRDAYWTWGTNGSTYVKIPKPRDTAIVSNATENILDSIYHPVEARKTRDVFLRDFSLRLPTGGGLGRGVVETYLMKKNVFRNQSLEPDYIKGLPKEQQITPYTTRMSDWLGQATGRSPVLATSPVQLEHLLSSATGGMYRRMMDTYDAVAEDRVGPEHFPVFRGLFMSRHQSGPVNEFYRRKVALKTLADREAVQAAGKSDKTIKQQALLDSYAEIMAAIRLLEGKKGKRRNYEYQKYIVGLARHALGFEEQASNPNPLSSPGTPKAIKDIVEDYKQRWVYQATNTVKPEEEYEGDGYKNAKNRQFRGAVRMLSLELTQEQASQLLLDRIEKMNGTLQNLQNRSYNLEQIYGK